MKKAIAILFVSLVSQFVFSQTRPFTIDEYFAALREQRNSVIQLEFLDKQPVSLLNALTRYYNDTTNLIRSKAYLITQQIGLQSTDPTIRQSAVRQLTAGCKDSYSGNVGLVLDYLSSFKKQDFTQEAKDNIKALAQPSQSHLDKVLKLIGFLQITDQITTIKPYTQPGNSQRIRWAAIVSLARMGDESSIQDMMTRARKLKVSDPVIEEVFPGLLYSRQRQALDYMVEVMRSDGKNCTSTGENTAPIACGYRIMEQLARAVKNYPLILDASGDVKTKDYKEALATVRAWFDGHKNYEIDNDTF